jgi:hypothetical protein
MDALLLSRPPNVRRRRGTYERRARIAWRA